MILQVKVIPNSRKSCLESFQGDVLKVRIKAPPINGKANAELIEFLSEVLRLSKTKIRILSGQTSRLKKLEIDGDILPILKELYPLLDLKIIP
jgi:uncharacterized protein (TIGR00251 family)